MRIFVYIIIFITFFDLFSQLPIMSPLAKSLGATPLLTGLAVGMYSLSNIVGNVASGFLTDKKGPFPMLFIGLLSSSIVLFLYFVATTPYFLLIVRFLHGLAAGLIFPAMFTFMANSTSPSKKGKGAALSGAFIGIAAMIGPAFGGIVANKTGETTVFVITGIIMLIASILTYFLLRSAVTTVSTSRIQDKLAVRSFFRTPAIVIAFIGALFLMFSQGVLAYMLPLKAIEMGGTVQTSGLLLSTFGIVAVIIFIFPTNKLFDRLHPMNTLTFGMILMGITFLFVSKVESIQTLYLLMCTYGIGFAFLFPSINSLLIGSTTKQNRGKAYGYFYAFFSIGVILGSGITGWLALSVNTGFLVTGILISFVAVALRSFAPIALRL